MAFVLFCYIPHSVKKSMLWENKLMVGIISENIIHDSFAIHKTQLHCPHNLLMLNYIVNLGSKRWSRQDTPSLKKNIQLQSILSTEREDSDVFSWLCTCHKYYNCLWVNLFLQSFFLKIPFPNSKFSYTTDTWKPRNILILNYFNYITTKFRGTSLPALVGNMLFS